MANTANIKPYADFAHMSAPYGGPNKFLSRVAQHAYQLGIMKERKTEGIKLAISSLIIGGLIWKIVDNEKDKKKLETIVTEAEKAMNGNEKKSIKGTPVRYYQVDSQI